VKREGSQNKRKSTMELSKIIGLNYKRPVELDERMENILSRNERKLHNAIGWSDAVRDKTLQELVKKHIVEVKKSPDYSVSMVGILGIVGLTLNEELKR
jgi:hypothetical protein